MKPFRKELQQVMVTADEFFVIFELIFLTVLYFRSDSISDAKMIAICIMVIIVFSLIKSVFVMLLIIILKIYFKIKYWIRRKLNYKKWVKLNR